MTGRVGGAFGGKSTRSSAVAAAAALAARKVGQPVFHALNRNDDFRLNAGRCECEVTYDVGFEEDGTITALDFKVGVSVWDRASLRCAEVIRAVSRGALCCNEWRACIRM